MKIMMVCLGNICRSPLAEGIMAQLIKDKKLDWTVDSSGTSGYHNGQHPDKRSIATAADHGIDISKQRSAEFSLYDFDHYDVIITMDQSNKTDLLALARHDQDKEKVKLILNYTFPEENRNVPDPYYAGGFEQVYTLIYKACHAFVSQQIKNNPR